MTATIFILTLAAAVGSGIVAGIFYGFSSFIMSALGKLPPHEGIAAMQSINIVVINPVFFLVFFGTALLSLVLGGYAVMNWGTAGAGLLFLGAGFYLVGCILVTIIFNVPLNNRLAKVEPASAEGAEVWQHYLVLWTRWNTVRTVAPSVSLVLYVLAIA